MNENNKNKVALVPPGGKEKWAPVITVDTPRGGGAEKTTQHEMYHDRSPVLNNPTKLIFLDFRVPRIPATARAFKNREDICLIRFFGTVHGF